MSRSRLRTPALMALWVVALAALFVLPVRAQDPVPPDRMSASEMRLALDKLRVLGSVLYLAAHPDDENTALISYLSYGGKLRVGYLSMTRGDGGQNLIGSEKGPLLGVIRTQELLAARRRDGAEQFFTRAVDFGYSKTPEETLEIWGEEEILSDVVRVIRRFQPDVIVTRFPTDGRGRHGHHTASAMLAVQATAAAADPARFPEQLSDLEPWQVRRVCWNAYNWGRTEPPEVSEGSPSAVEVGGFDPLLGHSYLEIAATSRTMHKSQGFGSAARRGSRLEYFDLLVGEPSPSDLLQGITTTWSRVDGGEAVDALVAQAQQSFDPENPSAIVPQLLQIDAAMDGLPDDPWVDAKRRELHALIRSAAGLWFEAVADRAELAAGETVEVTVRALQEIGSVFTLTHIAVPDGWSWTEQARFAEPAPLVPGEVFERTISGRITETPEESQPYWLREESSLGRFHVEDPSLIGLDENEPVYEVTFTLRADRREITYAVPVVYRWTDRVMGERYRSVVVAPTVTLAFDRDVYLFPGTEPREVLVQARSAAESANGNLWLEVPDGWGVEPSAQEITLTGRGAEKGYRFTLTPTGSPSEGSVRAYAEVGGERWNLSRTEIDYEHIPVQVVYEPASARVVRLDLAKSGSHVGYVMGSGDQVPEALGDIGYEVSLLEEEDLEAGALSRFDAIVVGIRAYNTRDRLKHLEDQLRDYVREGGVVVVQYNTVNRELENAMGPYPFQLSRDRVTVEEAEVRFVRPDHPLLTTPNEITQEDFDGWVQERGLYFSDQWDERYQTVLSMNDPGEEPKEGSLLYAEYGDGVYIYTGLSMFRELPAGVPGAYRLFANFVSGGR